MLMTDLRQPRKNDSHMYLHRLGVCKGRKTSDLRIEVLIRAAGWKKIMPRPQTLIKSIVKLGFEEATSYLKLTKSPISVNFYLTGDADIHRLNRLYRQKNKPTNVLAFPSNEEDSLGDVALGLGVIQEEAAEQKKDVREHALHLILHGFLHLLGFTHNKKKDAEIMENIEIKVLQRLGITNPYQSR